MEIFACRHVVSYGSLGMSLSAPGTLGIVAAYFNSCGYQSRRDNFQLFYESLGPHKKDCMIVELGFNDHPFDLPDSVQSLRFRTDDVLWHKEALLNIGIQEMLRRGYDAVGWIDADVIFENQDWHENILKELQNMSLCQMFRTAQIGAGDGRMNSYDNARSFGLWGGGGWAMHADIARAIPLYDRMIVGGFDTVFCYGALGKLRDIHAIWRPGLACVSEVSPSLRAEILDWANKWYDTVGKSIGFANNSIRTLPHGTTFRRAYGRRNRLLADFDPRNHTEMRSDGVLRWSDKAPDTLRQNVLRYFLNRREDDAHSSNIFEYLQEMNHWLWRWSPIYRLGFRVAKAIFHSRYVRFVKNRLLKEHGE